MNKGDRVKVKFYPNEFVGKIDALGKDRPDLIHVKFDKGYVPKWPHIKNRGCWFYAGELETI